MRLKIALALLLPTAALAQPPTPLFYSPFPEAQAYIRVSVQLGWYNDTQAWHFCTSSNGIDFANLRARGYYMILAAKLSSALVPRVPAGDIAARPMYMVTNFQNPPVFSTAPGQTDYSALWQVFYVTWLPGVTPRPITNADPASPTNPTGLPGPSEASIAPTQAVLDCPILVLGPLACPGSANAPGYIIPQAVGTNAYLKYVIVPVWAAYCEFTTPGVTFPRSVWITDVGDPALASVLGANLAPGLLNLPDSDTSDFFVMRGPKPLTQLPVLSSCPNGNRTYNTNLDYSPIMRYVVLQRNIPPHALVKSPDYIQLLLNNGGLVILAADQRINASVLPGG